jgi:hypothetical protein
MLMIKCPSQKTWTLILPCTTTLLQSFPSHSNFPHMETRVHMWATYSTIRASKIGLGTLLSHLPLSISLLCNFPHMETRVNMWVTYSTIRASKIGLGTLLSYLPLTIYLLCIKKSCPASTVSSSILNAFGLW